MVDELDVMRTKLANMSKLEAQIVKYKKREESMSEIRDQMAQLETQNQEYLDKMLNMEAEVETIPLLKRQIEEKQSQVAKFLIESKADVNKYNGDKSPLMLATRVGDAEIIELLSENKAEVEKLDINGWTCLHHAARLGHLEVVQALLQAKTNLFLKTSDAFSAIVNAKNGF